MDENESSELARRASRGDEDAWEKIYRLTCARLYALLVYYLGSREDALDVLQETYLCAFQYLHGYRGEGSLEAWLAAIAMRRASTWRRRLRARCRRWAPLEEGLAAPADIARDPLSQGETSRLHSGLNRLTPRQRSAILLREWAEMSFREIGETLGCDEATARVHYHRARMSMRKWIPAESVAPAGSWSEEHAR